MLNLSQNTLNFNIEHIGKLIKNSINLSNHYLILPNIRVYIYIIHKHTHTHTHTHTHRAFS